MGDVATATAIEGVVVVLKLSAARAMKRARSAALRRTRKSASITWFVLAQWLQAKIASEPDSGVGTRKAVGVANQFFPGRPKFDFVEAAVPSGQCIALEEKRTLEKFGMMPASAGTAGPALHGLAAREGYTVLHRIV
ncbi:hypothetical protein ACVCNR_22395 (plasmid) [Aquamicrobium terrae]